MLTLLEHPNGRGRQLSNQRGRTADSRFSEAEVNASRTTNLMLLPALIRLRLALLLHALVLFLGLPRLGLTATLSAALAQPPTHQPTRPTSPTRAQGAWLGTRPSTSLGEVDHPQARRAEDGRVGATPDGKQQTTLYDWDGRDRLRRILRAGEVVADGDVLVNAYGQFLYM